MSAALDGAVRERDEALSAQRKALSELEALRHHLLEAEDSSSHRETALVGRAHELGIDVKSYACPRLLGDTLSERLGGLTTFDERYVAIPDAIVNRRPGYLEDLRYAYRGSTSVVFGKVSEIAARILG